MAKKPVSDQMELFEDGGFKDQGNTKDPISNNPVPVGSIKKEVRDDIPANLSEGEFVLPADVVRYHGLEKIMGFRDQAKQGLQKMENMGQMGNSDQATLPDGVPFQQMAEGGAVPVPTIQQPEVVSQNQIPGVQYVAPTTQAVRPSIYSFNQQMPQVTVPTQPSVTVPTAPAYQAPPAYRQSTSTAATPKFSNLLGTQFGQLQESVTKKYVNKETGEEMYIPFVNGEPIYPIPNGFVEETQIEKDKQDEDINKAVQSTSVRQQQQDDGDSGGFDASSTQDYKVAMQLSEAEAKARGTTGLLGNLMQGAKDLFSKLPGAIIVDNVLNKLNPDREFSQGPVSDIYGDDYITDANQKEIYAKQSGYSSLADMTKQYGVEPTFKFGNTPGDVSLVTGKPYNFAGQSRKKDGTLGFTSWDEWTDNLSDSYDTGWSGGFTTEAEIQAAMDAHDARVNKGVAGYTTLSKDSAGVKVGGWNRSKVDAYNDKIAERKGGYIDRTMVNGKKGPNYGNFVKGKPTVSNIIDDTKSKVKTTPTAKSVDVTKFGVGAPPDDGFVPPTPPPAAVNLSPTLADYSDDGSDSGSSDSGLDASSSVDTDEQSDNFGGGWTAKGGFINKRTMTMSKISPNKKKRGGLASRR